MLRGIQEGTRKYILEHYVQIIQSFAILIVSAVIAMGIIVVMSKNVIYAPEYLYYTVTNEKVGYIDNGLQGIFSYGPFNNLSKGYNKITIQYETDTDTKFDICYRNEAGTFLVLMEGDLKYDKSSKTIVICNEADIQNASFEVRTYYPGMGYLQVNGISIRQCFCFDSYMKLTLVVMILSMLFVCGRRLLRIWERPREVLCFGCFYIVIVALCLYSMTFLVGQQEKLWMHSALNILIVLHAFGCKRGLYDNEVVTRKLSSMAVYVLLFCSLCHLDRIMQRIISKDVRTVYKDDIPYIFTLSIVACIVFITALIRKLWMKRIFYGIIYYTFVLLLAVQDIYYQVFNRLFSFKDMQLVGEGSNYTGYVLSLINGSFWSVFFPLLVIGVAGIFLMKYTIAIGREWMIAGCSIIVPVVVYSHTLYTDDYGEWNSFENDNFIYETMNDRVKAYRLCGFYQYELKDLKKTVMRDLARDEERSAEIEAYFEAREGERAYDTNLMTGTLEGKNVIFVLMESIDDIACREDVMPTLYKMSVEGINFSNMYASIYGSAATINTETVTNIGYYAPLDGSMIYSFADNSFPDSLAARFMDAGYAARQYHFNIPSFYDRGTMSRTFGYKEYVSFKEKIDGSTDTEVDTVLVEEDGLYQMLIQDEKFLDYIISYTAHMPYGETDNHVQIALERYPEYEGMTYSEEINYYFAKARITDDMLSGLIQKLTQDGLLENTVIVAIGDHYPFGIQDKDFLYELSGVERYEQLLYKVPCVIWSPGIEAVKVDKTVSSIDLLPTIVNLMGLGDCSVYLGHDIFDESYEGYAYFADGSWIAGDSYYYQGKLVFGTMDENEIADMNRKVMETITANDNILHANYWYKH